MRDNVSIIFAAIFAVLLLIVFPLFSLLTRQDNIAYNEVLTLTTNFVDSVRTKGYFTEKEYTDYLVKLAATQNTYKVDMECHKKLLIKDVNKYTDENPVWVDDTAVYYNSYIESELKNLNIIKFDEGDEFYIKVYNTNITTASLMYNFFLGSSIPRKIINIGYGGKVLNSTGDEFTKTAFNYSYTPYVTFGEVTNNDGKEFIRCYDEEAGTYEMQYCVRNIDIDNEDNNPIFVNFELHNFAKISEKELSTMTFENNKEYFMDAIKKSISLRGNYISSYEVNIESISYEADSIKGTISISDIAMGSGAWKTTAYIVIEAGLGIGSTGASSSEGTTEKLTLVRKVKYNVNVEGPYLNKDTTQEVGAALTKSEKIYYKVILTDSDTIEKLELYDTLNSKIIGTEENVKGNITLEFDKYDVEVRKNTTKTTYTEYWISVTPKFDVIEGVYDNQKYELQLKVTASVYYDLGKTEKRTAISDPVTWENMIFNINCKEIEYQLIASVRQIKLSFNKTNYNNIKSVIESNYNGDSKAFFQALVDNEIIYIVKDNQEKVKIKVSYVENNDENKFFRIRYYEVLTGGPVATNVAFNFKNSNTSVVSDEVYEYIVNVPRGYTASKDNGNIIIRCTSRIDGTSWKYCWISVNKKFEELESTNDYYGEGITKDSIKNSIEKYGGFYVRYGGVNVNTSFADAWSDTLGRGGDQLFSSMIYKWQLDSVYIALGGSSPNNTERIWVADKGENLTAVFKKKTGYEYEEYYNNGSIYKKVYSVEVLYIK